jgi:dipeptidase E
VRLFLSSSMLGDHADRLIAMTCPGARVAIIANALDNFPDFQRGYLSDEVHPLFASQGFAAEDFDLGAYFDRNDALAADLGGFDIVWAIGGNSFLLRRAMRASGFDAIIRPLLKQAPLVYGGWSAGSVVAAPDLFGIDHVDDPHAAAPGYPPGEILWEGLGLIDCSLVPHVDSDHPESPAATESVALIRASGRAVQPLRDGEVMVVDRGEVTILPRR